MSEQNLSPAVSPPNAEQRIAELERQLSEVNGRYASSSQEAKRLAQQVNQMAQSLPRQDVPDRSKPGYEARLETLGIPVEDIRELVRGEARPMLQEEMQPIFKMGTARQKMLAKHSDYAQFESAVGNWINQDDERAQKYARLYTADPEAAVEWAYYGYGSEERAKLPPQPQPSGSEHAAIPSQRSGDSRNAAYSADVGLEDARRAYQDSPNKHNAERLARERLHRVITDDHLYGNRP